MAGPFCHVIFLLRGRQIGGDGQRRLGLAKTGNIILLTLDGEDADVGDRRWIDLVAPMQHLALGQRMILEHDTDRLEIEFRRHVADRPIFFVKILRQIGAVIIALNEVFEHLVMRHHVAAEVHRHETRELQESGIHPPPRADIGRRDRRNHILAEPAVRPLGRQRVDGGWGLARVDRSAHHGQRLGPIRILVGAHHASRGVTGYGRLAHREHVRTLAFHVAVAALPDHFEEFDDVIDIIFEIESAVAERHLLRIAPVGDVHVRHRQHPLDRTAKQRGIMARHRRDDQQL